MKQTMNLKEIGKIKKLICPFPIINKENYANRLERWIKSINNSEEYEYRNRQR